MDKGASGKQPNFGTGRPARTGQAGDERAMAAAIEAAWPARRFVSPRPWVGAVLVAGSGEEFSASTDGRSGPHAEVRALRAAGDRAAGATIYVTLEPCSHHGKTPPCADAIIEAGVRRAVVAIEDPDPKVCGQGIARLRDAGIEVVVGVGAAAARRQLEPYLVHRLTGRPYVVLKLAATLDGCTAAPDGTSRWITGADARLDAHRLRADSDAVLVGAATVRADDPELTVRLPAGEADGVEPLRVVLGSAPADARVHPCVELGGDVGGVLDELGRRGVLQLMIEGGAGVAHEFHVAGAVDRYVFYLAGALFGGDDARPMFSGRAAPTIADVWRGRIVGARQLGDDLRVDVVPAPEEGA